MANWSHTHGVETIRIKLGSKTVTDREPRGGNPWYMSTHPHVVLMMDNDIHMALELMKKSVEPFTARRSGKVV